MMEKKLLNLETVASLYDIKPSTLRQFCLQGSILIDDIRREFKAVKIGKRWFVDPTELEKYLRR